jgi:tetratricopeptide (TPR) repeat protein
MYNRESRVLSIIKKGNKFYFKQNKTFLPLTYSHLMGINFDYKVVPTLVERLPWLRFMTEHNICRNVSFNTMVSKKIFSLEKALRHEYKLPLPAAKILVTISDYQASYLKYYIEYLDNVENLHNTLPTYDFGIFNDTVKMAMASCFIQGVGETMKGVQILLGIVKEHPDHIPANILLGKMAVQSQQFDKAIVRLERLKTIEPKNTEILYFLAEAYKGKGEKEKAIVLFEQCKKLVNNPAFSKDIDTYINSFK